MRGMRKERGGCCLGNLCDDRAYTVLARYAYLQIYV